VGTQGGLMLPCYKSRTRDCCKNSALRLTLSTTQKEADGCKAHSWVGKA